MNKEIRESLFQLVRLGIGQHATARLADVDWQEVKDLAVKQGLGAVVLDGIEKLPEKQRLPKVFLLEWIGETLQGYEYRYDQYCKAIAELAGFYNSHGYKMMVLKGYACSLDWPKPEHRPCGDIDIWLFGAQRGADQTLSKEKNIEIDKSHHHHTVFYWGEFMVENHFDFINVHQNKTNAKLEKVLKELGSEANINHNENDNSVGNRIRSVEINGEKIYLPSPNLQALFLLKHTMLHFVLGEFSLRQLLDWAFFVKKHGEEVDWKWLMEELAEYGMLPAFNIFNAICVENLGFEASIFHQVQFSPTLKDKVLDEIINPKYDPNDPKELFHRLIYKYKRWKGSGWKYELCYNESRWSSFWSGVWSHIIKP